MPSWEVQHYLGLFGTDVHEASRYCWLSWLLFEMAWKGEGEHVNPQFLNFIHIFRNDCTSENVWHCVFCFLSMFAVANRQDIRTFELPWGCIKNRTVVRQIRVPCWLPFASGCSKMDWTILTLPEQLYMSIMIDHSSLICTPFEEYM